MRAQRQRRQLQVHRLVRVGRPKREAAAKVLVQAESHGADSVVAAYADPNGIGGQPLGEALAVPLRRRQSRRPEVHRSPWIQTQLVEQLFKLWWHGLRNGQAP